jgi:hypothetical protein
VATGADNLAFVVSILGVVAQGVEVSLCSIFVTAAA